VTTNFSALTQPCVSGEVGTVTVSMIVETCRMRKIAVSEIFLFM